MANILQRLIFVFRRPIFVFHRPNNLSSPHPPPPPPVPLVEIESENIVFSGTFKHCNFGGAFPSAAASKMTSEPSQVLESAILVDVVGGKDSGPSATAAKMMLDPEKSSGKTVIGFCEIREEKLLVSLMGLKE